MTVLKFVTVLAATACLSGCLVSEQPLLNDANAKATPLAPGRYQACGEDNDCKPLNVSRDGALFSFEPQGEDASLGRFRSLGRGSFLAQMWEEGDGSFFYFYAVKIKTGVKMSMVGCGDIGEKTRASLVKSGDLSVSDDGATCTAKTLKGAERATRDYGRRLSSDSAWTVLTRTGE